MGNALNPGYAFMLVLCERVAVSDLWAALRHGFQQETLLAASFPQNIRHEPSKLLHSPLQSPLPNDNIWVQIRATWVPNTVTGEW